MKYSVDRIEDGIAVCEDENGKSVNFEVAGLPKGIKEGDLFSVTDDKFEILTEETSDRRKKMAELQKSIFTKKKRAD